MKILGIVGNLGTGKDTIASILDATCDWVIAAQADELKRCAHRIFELPNHVMFGESSLRSWRDPRADTEDYWSDCHGRVETHEQYVRNLFPEELRDLAVVNLHALIDHFAAVRDKANCRYILQRLGTEWGRETYPNVWVHALGRTLKALRDGGWEYFRERGLVRRQGAPTPEGVAITDCRFDNEIDAVHGWDGKAVWVDASTRVKPSGDTHKSEPKYDDFAHLVDGVIDNNGTLDQLENAVHSLVTNQEFWG